jgi:uncharacterized protein (DUF2252 family)
VFVVLMKLTPRSALFVIAVVVASPACAPASPTTATPAAVRDPLAIDGAALTRDDPRTARKVAKTPFAYFRYTNRPFVDLVCSRYEKAITTMPLVHAHGDAHLEQYAVAAEGRGLADFDASAVGPPVVDLARFATSVVLAWPKDERAARSAIDAFVAAYVRALDDPSATIPEPSAAARLRSKFAPTRVPWLDHVQSFITPTAKEDQAYYEAGWLDFVTQMRAEDPAIDPSFFTIKVGGKLTMGVGSAHADKFLARIEGPTPAPEDDLIIEAKALEPGALGTCMRSADLDATRVIKGQAQISNAPQRFLAAVKIHGKPFYSHTWLSHYTEISAATDIQSPRELKELAEDVGLQLGRGHAKQSDQVRVPDQRRVLKEAAESVGRDLGDTAVDLAKRVTQAWATYRPALPN